MKKILSLALCAVMVLCAVVPCFAAGGTMTSFGDSSPFNRGWLVTTKNFLDYVDDQPVLFNNTGRTNASGNLNPDYSKAGFAADSRGFITLWGGNNVENHQRIWADKPTFQVPFTVAEDGLYSFAFMVAGVSTGSVGIPCRVDDGDWYSVMTGTTAYNAPGTYYGMNNIELTAGEHVFHFSCPAGFMDTQYYYGVKITGEKLTPEAPVVPEIDYTLDATANLPAMYTGGTFVSAYDTIEELNEGMNYTKYTNTQWPELDGSVALGSGQGAFKFKFNAKRAGEYYFAFAFSAGGANRGFQTIAVDGEATDYTAVSNGAITFPKHEYFPGMLIELEAGEHEIQLTPTASNPYFRGFYYCFKEPYVDPNLKGQASLPAEYARASYVHAATMLPLGENDGLTWNVYENSQWADLDGAVTLGTQDKYKIPFTAPVTGTYSFAMVFSAGGAGRGLQSITVDGKGAPFNAISSGGVAFPKHEYFPGMTVYLEEGTHYLEISRTASMPYYRGFYYYCSKVDSSAGSGEAVDGDMMAAPMNPIPGVVVTPSIPGGSAEMALQNLINPVPDTEASDNAPVEDPLAPPQPNMDATAPAVPGGMGSAQWAPAMPACTVR